MTSDQRIAKLLARAGVASRREIERMIAEGRIALNGTTIDTPATLLSTLDGITVDGQPVAAPEPTRLFLYHKPTGLLVTEHDPAGRPTIYDRLPEGLPRLMPVGRLDLNTEGLLLLTTDGGFKRQLELPATGVERTYRARAYGDITQAQLEELIHGIEIDGIRYGQIDANLERRTGANVWIEMTLREGKNREVRRVLEHLGLQVSRLIRLRYGPFLLDDLPVGAIGEVKGYDIVEFRRTLEGGIPADAIKPPKVKPGFRAPPARTVSDRPARSAPVDGGVPKRQDRSTGRDGVRPERKAHTGDRPGPARERSFRSDDRAERPARPPRSGATDRPRRDDAGRSSAYGDAARPGRSRSEAKPFAKSGERPVRGDDRSDRSARPRSDAKPFAKSGDRPFRSDDRSDRPARPSRGGQGPSGRSGGPAKPGARGGRPGGGGSRPSRPGGNR
ncbi:pseudouridine synthase [uncultured Sphingomonas sp.]|uniref:pseudouridine synthase n=1 Tax=uncultured Sphingomonas sp. TaxID=158754 RepID=UPI003749E884